MRPLRCHRGIPSRSRRAGRDRDGAVDLVADQPRRDPHRGHCRNCARSPTRRSARAAKAGGRAWCSACHRCRRAHERRAPSSPSLVRTATPCGRRIATRSCSISAWAASRPRPACARPIRRPSRSCGRPAAGRMLQNGRLMHRLPRLSPHRVFCCRMGRVEVYQPIPAPDGKSPEGPHTHVLPRLLAHGRSMPRPFRCPTAGSAGMRCTRPSADARRWRSRPRSSRALSRRSRRSWAVRRSCAVAGKQAAFATNAGSSIADSDERRHALGFRIGQRQRSGCRRRVAEFDCGEILLTPANSTR